MGSWRSVTGDTAFKATHLYKYQDVCMSILANIEQRSIMYNVHVPVCSPMSFLNPRGYVHECFYTCCFIDPQQVADEQLRLLHWTLSWWQIDGTKCGLPLQYVAKSAGWSSGCCRSPGCIFLLKIDSPNDSLWDQGAEKFSDKYVMSLCNKIQWNFLAKLNILIN